MDCQIAIPQILPVDFFYIDYNICLTLNGFAMVSQLSTPMSLLVKPDEAAKLLSISTRTLWTLTREGIVPCVRLGKSVRYSLDTLRAVIAQRENRQRDDLNGRGQNEKVSPVRGTSSN
jgi:excisionase family DNA binding protein